MSKVEDFLIAKDEEAIVDAIRNAEMNTSGEIRIHLESSWDKDVLPHAYEVFKQLHIANTQDRNGVLIYVAVKNRKLVILGDKGINDVVPENFWDSTKDVIINHFKQGDFKQGLVEGILKAGEQLKVHFPYQKDDSNELSDEISIG